MKKTNIIHWYYNEALHELLGIWKNFLFFFWEFFSIKEMLVTILAPWRRDVSVSHSRGFHPLKTLSVLFENIVSRLLGCVVRLCVVSFGFIVEAFVLTFGLLLSFFWLVAPFGLLFLLFWWASLSAFFGVFVAFCLSWAGLIFIFYAQSSKVPAKMLEDQHLLKQVVFERICGRLGIARKRFPDEIFGNNEPFADFLKARNVTLEEYLKIADFEIKNVQKKLDDSKFWTTQSLRKICGIGRQWKYGYTVALDHYCLDLSQHDFSEYARSSFVGRNDEYELLKLTLERPDQNCALVVGNAGIGKKTLIHELARNIRFRDEDEMFLDKRIMILDLARFISDVVSRGEDVENSLRKIFYEASYAGNIVLVIEHFEYFLGKEDSAFHPNISAVLVEYLNVPTFQVIALSTSKEYHQLIEKQQEVAKYFEVIELHEPTESETLTILLNQLEKFESSSVLFTYKALEKIVRDSGKHNWEFPLPERAIDLAMGVLMFWEKKSNEEFVSEKVVSDYLSLKTGVPQGEIEGLERKKLLNLEATLHRQVIGQDEAINQVSQALKRSRSGLGDSKKPVGSFLFLGPTGVGKTETAKALAKAYFGDENKMIRLDMSEFQTPNSIDRLLGSSALNQQGRLVTQIKDNPYSLLLLDEIEKAYPEILDIFLQILDEGYVNDAFGEKINFRNTMIIATSNAGAAMIKNMVEDEKPAEQIKEAVIDFAIANNIFRTEFLNRFEGVIFFRPLNNNELKSVVRLQLQKFIRRLDKEKNIKVEYNENILEKIIQKGYNPIFGARSLNRYIENEIESILAEKIISGEAKSGEKIMLSI
ncbi:MAG: AAA family ATPase [bacterium]